MKESAAHIGRVGGLAVALGVGAWLAATPCTAAADAGSAVVDSVVADPSVLLSPAAAADPGLDVADLDGNRFAARQRRGGIKHGSLQTGNSAPI